MTKDNLATVLTVACLAPAGGCARTQLLVIAESGSEASISAGNTHACVVLEGGRIKCWGRNNMGQLGLGDTENRGDDPGELGDALPAVDLGTDARAIAVTAGFDHTCALLTSGRVKCWGSNGSGKLGLGDTENRGDEPGEMGDALPTLSLGTDVRATAIAAGAGHTCALLSDRRVKCWGRSTDRELGIDDIEARGDEPGEMGDDLPSVDLAPATGALAVDAGNSHTCALLDTAQVRCWGNHDSGQTGGIDLPQVDLGTGRTVQSLGLGDLHSCAILNGGDIKCWGRNASGQSGVGNTTYYGYGVNGEPIGDELPVVDVGTATVAVQVRGGREHTCALLADGTVRCWGNGPALGLGSSLAGGSLGDDPGEMGASLPVVQLPNGVGAVALDAGSFHTCVLTDDDQVACWGQDLYGQVGGGGGAAYVPVIVDIR